MAYNLVGKNFAVGDAAAKVTGEAKYAEDFRAEGMVFSKLWTSPIPHARVVNLDTSEALALPGVLAILTPDDVPAFPPPQDPILTYEPHFVGEPILAIAAESEEIAAEAIEKIRAEFEPLPFTVDPLDSLFPGGPNARLDGNVAASRIDLQQVKWGAGEFAGVDQGRLPMGAPAEEWAYGDLEAGFAAAALVIEESFVTGGLAHHAMEPRSSMAYWQNGTCFIHTGIQSQAASVPSFARLLDVPVENVVLVSEYCGGGFGGKISAGPTMSIAAHLSKKLNGRPVQLRLSRENEYAVGRGRPAFQGNVKIGFAADGRVTALDLYLVHDNGPHIGAGDFRAAANAASIVFTPPAMRWRAIPVLTNTPPRGAQRGPGENQIAMALEPLIDRAARELGIDRVAIRQLNAPTNDSLLGADQGPITSAALGAAIAKAAEMFNWEERKTRSGQRNGSKVTGIGVGSAYHSAGSSGFDGLLRIGTDGKLYIHTGVGNLGTHSHYGTARYAAEAMGYDWNNVEVVRGRTDRHLPWTVNQAGSNTVYTTTRVFQVAAEDAKQKLLEIGALEMGGAPEDYDIQSERVVSKADASKSITFAQAASRATDLGGKYDGHVVPEDLNPMTKASVAALAGTGLIGVAKDNMPKPGVTPGLVAAFVEVEVDVETGKVEMLDYVAVADAGTILHPAGFSNQMTGGAVMGFGMAVLESYAYDPVIGVPARAGFYQAKPASYLDVPKTFETSSTEDHLDPTNPIGAKGIGEPAEGAGGAALVSAITDALGGHNFARTPITADMIVNVVAGREQSYRPLQVNTI